MTGTAREHWAEVEGRELAVPGSASNLGPGFDTLGLALQVYLRVRVLSVDGDGRGELACDFIDRPLLGANRIAQAWHLLGEQYGVRLPDMRVQVRSEIPPRSGLGSSAAATIAGFRLFEALHGPRPTDELLSAAASLEGHGDNAAASLLGGLTGCCEVQPQRFSAWTRRWPDRLRVVVATPEAEVETREARGRLPATVRLEDAVFNLQRLAWLLHAIDAGDLRALAEAMRDRCHQPHRAPLVPAWDRLCALRHPGLLGLCISGSGPSVVGFAVENVPAVEQALRREYERAGIRAAVRTVGVHHREGT